MMNTRLIACFAFCISAFLPAVALAEENANQPEIDKLRQELAIINTEIKSELEQVLVLQAAIRENAQLSLPAQGRSPDPMNYGDMTAAQRQAVQRETELNNRIQAILARGVVHDARKQRLLERLRVLTGVQ